MKKTVWMLLALLCAIGASAQKVTGLIAKKSAASFWSKAIENTNKKVEVAYCTTDANDTLLYVCNIDNSGFVVVSGDMRCNAVLGYSTEGVFNKDMAPACKAWLQQYSGQIAAKKKNKNSAISPEWNSLLTNNNILLEKKSSKSVAPLLTTNWNQDKYYNHFCPAYPTGPDGHCYTGCVATAMAQIMKYYNYPDHGVGSHSYSHPYFGTISANFDTTYYDWTHMGNNGNLINQNAISTLMFQCGVSVDMNYSPLGSGAQTENAVLAFKNYFHYRNTIKFVKKSTLDNYDWIALLKDNLDQNHPVLYSGSGSGGGHAWVCDGYDNSDKFHMNWGWSGANNGYFQVDTTSLDSGNGDFGTVQSAIVNIVPYFAPYCMTSRTFTDSTRVISDGSGYSYYFNDTDCDWLIKPTGAERVVLQFTDFITETANDVVSVYDGETTSDPLLGTYSGSNTPPLITAANGKMLITFSSNSSTQGEGWTAKYWSLKHGDGIEEDEDETLAVYPNPATNDISIMNLVSFDEPVIICLYDYSGKIVFTTSQNPQIGNTMKIDISMLNSGFYIISLQSQKHNYRTKFIKQ